MLILTDKQMLASRANSVDALLSPISMVDGRFYCSEAVLEDPRHHRVRNILAACERGDFDLDQVFAAAFPVVLVGGHRAYLASRDRAPWAIRKAADSVYRFEVREDDFGYSGDATNNPPYGNRRSELVSYGSADARSYTEGDEVWQSFSFVIGDDSGLIQTGSGVFGLAAQWHSVDTVVSRSPVLGVDLAFGGVLSIVTRSSDEVTEALNGVAKYRYQMARPAVGVTTSIVFRFIPGENGHLQAWVNGSEVFDADIPLGYYDDLLIGQKLAYPQFGMYTRNGADPIVIYTANMEWGTDSLLARVTAPLAVPDVDWERPYTDF